jgi:chromosomal replication initiation ATPase DnaA
MAEEQIVRREQITRNPRRSAGSGRQHAAGREADDEACCRIAAQLVASHYDMALVEVVGRARRSHRATRARHMAMYLAHVVCGLSLAAVGAGFNRDRTTASYACHKIEDARDDPAIDAALADLEISAGVLLELQSEEKRA